MTIVQSKQAKLCFLMEAFYPIVNGAVVQIMLLAERLVNLGSQVTVVTRQTSIKDLCHERIKGIDVFRVKSALGVRRIGKYLMMVPCFFILLKERKRCDLIVVSDFKVLGVLGVLTAKLLRKRCFLRGASCGEMDGSYAFMFTDSPNIIKRITVRLLVPLRNAILKNGDYFLSISSAVTKELISCGVPEKQIIDFACGVDTRTFKPLDSSQKRAIRKRLNIPNAVIFTYTGRLAKGKGLNILVKVWEKVVQTQKNLHLLLIGSGQGYSLDCEQELKKMTADRNLERSISFVGKVENVNEYLQASDCFVFPTEYEALGNSLLEAMSCGLPCIASRVGGIVDIITHNVNGLLVENGDEEQLLTAIETIVTNKDMADSLGRQARITAIEKFNIDQKVRVLETLVALLSTHNN